MSGTDRYETHCSHMFHKKCINQWYTIIMRLQCPYCGQCEGYDMEIIRCLENLFEKLHNCHGVRDFNVVSLQEYVLKVPEHSRWYHKKAIDFIKLNDAATDIVVKHCYQSMSARMHHTS